jgi:TrmH family RNA methyltransferase
MPGGAESLNVAIATAIILYEKVRQNSWNYKKL